ncbi:hypothetical protein BIY45_04795 [Stenotrophomonas sp. BIIR7]|nr:hypothetical protein BIY45_04795 [Stenotrophomonas sp. BIIR7]
MRQVALYCAQLGIKFIAFYTFFTQAILTACEFLAELLAHSIPAPCQILAKLLTQAILAMRQLLTKFSTESLLTLRELLAQLLAKLLVELLHSAHVSGSRQQLLIVRMKVLIVCGDPFQVCMNLVYLVAQPDGLLFHSLARRLTFMQQLM